MQHVMLMEFLDESETFCLGFECGNIWTAIEEGMIITRRPIHTKNIDQIKLICETFGVDCEIEKADDTWSYLTVKSIF